MFKIFAGRINVETAMAVESDSSDGDMGKSVNKTLEGDGLNIDHAKSIELLNIPAFIQYFKVTDDDEDFFEEVIAQMASLGTNEDMLQKGVSFDEIMTWLVDTSFLLGAGLTDKEPESVLNA